MSDRDRPGEGDTRENAIPVTVFVDGTQHELAVPAGTILRDALLEAGLSPYTAWTESLNCGGRGICATCGVRVRSGRGEEVNVQEAEAEAESERPDPTHWHDRLAARFGYPRLSCQIPVEEPLTVTLVTDKRLWGGRKQ